MATLVARDDKSGYVPFTEFPDMAVSSARCPHSPPASLPPASHPLAHVDADARLLCCVHPDAAHSRYVLDRVAVHALAPGSGAGGEGLPRTASYDSSLVCFRRPVQCSLDLGCRRLLPFFVSHRLPGIVLTAPGESRT